MSKYIKIEDAIREIEEMPNCYNGWSDTYDKAEIIGVLDELPTIDIVRCKDCKWCIAEEGVCDKFGAVLFADEIENHFCRYGERIEE